MDPRKPLVIGHRGFCSVAPENTLPSFGLALRAGASLVELDYRHSQDGVPVVIHDAELDRTTDARKRWKRRHVKVADTPLAQLKNLDAGSWFDPKYAGSAVPTLAEALDAISQAAAGGCGPGPALLHEGCPALIERKAGDAATCVGLLQERNLVSKVIVQAFDWEFLRAFHEQEPQQVLGALGPPTKLTDGRKPPGIARKLGRSWLDELQATGAKIVVWNRRVSKESVRLARERGLEVWVYTINEIGLAKKLARLGVTGLITNDPRKMVSAL